MRTHALPDDAVALVEASYERLQERLRAVAIAFYERVFETAPSLHAFFPRDDAEQRRIALSFVGFVMANLRSPQHLYPLLGHMGARGLARRAGAPELEAIGRALVATLRDFEGPHWTLDTAHAWALMYVWVTTALRHGAEDDELVA